MAERFDQAFWDERYRSRPALWSGQPNPHLIAESSGLAADAALDVGSGEGADAIWLAERGWRVTAIDISAVALERAAAHAAQAGPEVAGRIAWVQADLRNWEPGPSAYDLISAQYMHLPMVLRQALFDRLAAAVAPGGTLLVVGHHPTDMQTSVPRPQHPELFYTGDDIVARLDPGQWTIETNAAPGRTVEHDGNAVTIHDTVLRARRRP